MRITTRSRCQMVSALHCDLHNLSHYKMKRAEISREVWYGFPNSCWQHKEYKQRLDKMWNGFSSKAGISPSLHCMLAPLHHWWTGNLFVARQSWCLLVGMVVPHRTSSDAVQTQPKTEFSHLESGAAWSLESLTFQRPLLFLLWRFHYCKVCVKALLPYSSEELHFIITYFSFVLSKRSDIFIVFLILMYSNFPKRCFMHPW